MTILDCDALRAQLSERFVISGTGSSRYRYGTCRDALRFWLAEQAEATLSDTVIVAGGAQGWDTELAGAARDLGLPFYLTLPSRDYGAWYWGGRDRRGDGVDRHDVFVRMCERAAGVTFVAEHHQYGRANFARNEVMVALGEVFAVYDAGTPGTRHAVAAIQAAGKPYHDFAS